MPPVPPSLSYEYSLYLFRLKFLEAQNKFEAGKKSFEDDYFNPDIKNTIK